MIFTVPYFSNVAELLLGSIQAIDMLQRMGVVTKRTLFAPMTSGMELPAFYYNFFEPFGSGTVIPLDVVSSREHANRRCFSSMHVCSLPGLYHAATDSSRGISYGWWSLSMKETARNISLYYQKKHPEVFSAAQRLESEFTVVFILRKGYRMLTNVDELIDKCNSNLLPALQGMYDAGMSAQQRQTGDNFYNRTKQFVSVRCQTIIPTAKSFVDDLALLESQTHALVSLHGSGASLGYFLPPGSSLIEVVAHDFCGKWLDQYFKERMESQVAQSGTGYHRIVAGVEYAHLGVFQRNSSGIETTYPRDRDISIDWEGTLKQVLLRVAAGEIQQHGVDGVLMGTLPPVEEMSEACKNRHTATWWTDGGKNVTKR